MVTLCVGAISDGYLGSQNFLTVVVSIFLFF